MSKAPVKKKSILERLTGDKKKQDASKWNEAYIAAQAKASVKDELGRQALSKVDKGTEKLEATQERFEIFTSNLRKKSTAELQILADQAVKRDDPKIWGVSKKKVVEENPVTRAAQHIFLDSREPEWLFHRIARDHVLISVETTYFDEDYDNTVFYDKDTFSKLLNELLKQEITKPARARIVDVLKIYDLIVIALVIAQKQGDGGLVATLTNVLYAGISSKENYFDPELYKATAQILASAAIHMKDLQSQTLIATIASNIDDISDQLQVKMAPQLKYQKDLAAWTKKWGKKKVSEVTEPKPEEPRAEEYPKIKALIAQFKADAFNQAYFMQLIQEEEFPGLDQFQLAASFIREEILVGDLKVGGSGARTAHPIFEKALEYFSLFGADNPLLTADPQYLPQAVRDRFLNKLLGVGEVDGPVIIFNKSLKKELVAIIIGYINELMLQEPTPIAPDFAGLKKRLIEFSATRKATNKEKDRLEEKDGKKGKKSKESEEEPVAAKEAEAPKEKKEESKGGDEQILLRAKASKASQDAEQIKETDQRVGVHVEGLAKKIAGVSMKKAVEDIVSKDDPEQWRRKGVTQRFLSSSTTTEGSKKWAYYDTARSISKGGRKSPNTVVNLQAGVSKIDLGGIYYGRTQAFGLAIDDINLKDNEAAQKRSIMVCKIHEIIATLIASPDYPELREYLSAVLYSSVATCEDFYDTKLYSNAAKFIKDRIRQGDVDGSLTGEKRSGLLYAASAISILNQKLAKNLEVPQDAIDAQKVEMQMSFAPIGDNLTDDLYQKLIARNKDFEKLITSEKLIEIILAQKEHPVAIKIMEYLPTNEYMQSQLQKKLEAAGGGDITSMVRLFLADILKDENVSPPSLVLYNRDRLDDVFKHIIGYLTENPLEQLDPSTPGSLGLCGNGFRNYVDKQIRKETKKEHKKPEAAAEEVDHRLDKKASESLASAASSAPKKSQEESAAEGDVPEGQDKHDKSDPGSSPTPKVAIKKTGQNQDSSQLE